MQHLEVSGAVRHIYIYVVRQLRVNFGYGFTHFNNTQSSKELCVRVVGNGIICIKETG